MGLVLAQARGSENWDAVDQRTWIPTDHPARSALFDGMGFAVHGPVGNFTTATDATGDVQAISGYQPLCHEVAGRACRRGVNSTNESDVRSMSSTQGWTCGNMMAPPRAVASFFYELLGPPSREPNPILSPESLQQMLTFKTGSYFSTWGPAFGYATLLCSTVLYSGVLFFFAFCSAMFCSTAFFSVMLCQ